MDSFISNKILLMFLLLNTLFSVSQCVDIYVSNKASAIKKSKKACGSTIDDPCPTINAAVQIAEDYNQITILSSDETYKDCPIYVNKPLAFKGLHGKYGYPIIDCEGKDGLVFNYEIRTREQIKKVPVIKLDVVNLRIRNAKTGFSFLRPTKTVNLRLTNITLEDNEIDVSWANSPLCYLVLTNVVAIGSLGNAVELKDCTKAKVELVNTKLLGKYFKVESTVKSLTLDIDMEHAVFDMSNRKTKLVKDLTKEDDAPSSPIHVLTAVNHTSINIKKSQFLNHIGDEKAMISIASLKTRKTRKPCIGKTCRVNVLFNKATFRNNTASNGLGGAAWFNLTTKITRKFVPHNILFDSCNFIENSAWSGGAIFFSEWQKKVVRFNKCFFKDNNAIGTTTESESIEKDINDEDSGKNEEFGSGGALFVVGGKFTILGSKFEGNSATRSGGALYFTTKNATSLKIYDSEFRNKLSTWSTTEGAAMFLNDVQTIFYGKVIIDVGSSNGGESILTYEGRPSVLRMSNTSQFICPQGYNYEESRFTLKVKRGRPNYFPAYLIFAFSCKPCQDLFYSTTRGVRFVNGTETRGKCHKCPNGASCNGTIRARANFWGVVKGDVIEMTPCPKGYCCQREPCESYNTCNSHRTGTLCGHCVEGYTEGISTTKCYPNSKCNEAVWIWRLGNVVFIFVFLCFHLEIIKKLVKWSLWEDDEETTEYRANERTQNSQNIKLAESNSLLQQAETSNPERLTLQNTASPDYTRIEESPEYNNSGGYVKVFYYFYQAVLLIRLSSYISNSSFPNHVIDLLTPILNFQFTSIMTCGGQDIRPVVKIFLKNSVGFCVIGFCGFMYLVYKLLRYYRRKHSWSDPLDDQPGFQSRSFPVRLVGVVVHVILLSYVAQTQFAVQLLHCVKVGDKNVLYIDGSVTCYRSYQIFGWLYFLLVIVPFPAALFFGRKLLVSDRISWKQFIKACVFPPFYLCCWSYKYHKQRKGDRAWLTETRSRRDPFKEKILYILQYPYKEPKFASAIQHFGEHDWESVLMLRRLILVLVFIFVKSFLLRAYLFFLSSLVFQLGHVFLQPFLNENVNKLDNIALSLIVLISGLSISEASYNNAGQLVPSSVKILQILQDWFLAMLPIALILVFIAPRMKYVILRRRLHYDGRGAIPDDDIMIVQNPQIGSASNETSPLT